jgi:hypothetical protein
MAKLITEVSHDYEITESKTKGTHIVGIFSSAEVENNNKRRYKKELLEREIDKLTESKIDNKNAFGELGHPQNPEINLDKVAILTNILEWKGNDVYGRAKVLDTPMGNIARTLIKEGKLGISSRGLGTVGDEGWVNEDFSLLTYDLVADPSNPSSWVDGIYEAQEFEIVGSKKKYTMEDAKEVHERQIWQVLEWIGK